MKSLIQPVLLLVAGVALLVTTELGALDLLTGPIPYGQPGSMEHGAYMEMEVGTILDQFAYTSSTGDEEGEILTVYYYILIGGGNVMGLCVPRDGLEAARQLMDDPESGGFTAVGSVSSMGDDLLEHYAAKAESLSFSGHALPLVLEMDAVKGHGVVEIWVLTAAGLVSLLAGAVLLFRRLTAPKSPEAGPPETPWNVEDNTPRDNGKDE